MALAASICASGQGQQQPGLCQNGVEGVQLRVRHVLRGIEDRARADGCGRVRHDADERQSPAEHGVQLPERHGRRHADDDGCIPLPRLQHGSQLSCQTRQALRLHAEKQQLGRFRSLRVRADRPAQLLCQRLGLGRGAVGKQQRVAALRCGPRQRAAIFPVPMNPIFMRLPPDLTVSGDNILIGRQLVQADRPRAWSFCVEMPISQPRPNSPPSVKRVEALT